MSEELGNDGDKVEPVDPVLPVSLSNEEQTALTQHGWLFQELLKSDRFKNFFKINYDLALDEITKELFLIEVPYEVAARRSQELVQAEILSMPESEIVIGTPAMVKAADKILNKGKLNTNKRKRK